MPVMTDAEVQYAMNMLSKSHCIAPLGIIRSLS
jgi:hypothetical protein